MAIELRCRPASPGERAVAAFVDALVASVSLFVVWAFLGWFLGLVHFRGEAVGFGTGICQSSGCDYEWFAEHGQSGPSFWISLVLSSAVVIAMSGALTKDRRSPGQLAASIYPVPAGAVGTTSVEPPGRWQLLLRWTIVLVAFMVGTKLGGGMVGILLVTLTWLPSLVGPRRSLYDAATGVALVALVAQDAHEGGAPSGRDEDGRGARIRDPFA
jgi:hypothetical protein